MDARATILIVDDEPDVREVWRSISHLLQALRFEHRR